MRAAVLRLAPESGPLWYIPAALTCAREESYLRRSAAPQAVIVTALRVEYEAVRAHLVDPREQTHRGTVYETGSLSEGPWQVTIASSEASR